MAGTRSKYARFLVRLGSTEALMTTFMPRIIVGLALAAIVASGAQAKRVGAVVPTFDVTPSCRTGVNEGVRNDIKTCLDSEKNARDELVKQWNDFPPADRTLCTQASSMGGSPSYTELITCLEMQRDVRVLNERAARDGVKR
jgi:hypothetical protein